MSGPAPIKFSEVVVCIDGNAQGTTILADLELMGEPSFDFDATWRAVRRDDVLTLIYTSGTTGPPKGVELTHANLLSNITGLPEFESISELDRLVSYLPDAHIVNRYLAHYVPAVCGATVTTVANPKNLVTALPDARPTIFVAVPMFWYKIKAALEAALTAQNGVRGRLARWAVAAGARKAHAESRGEPVPVTTRIRAAAAERVVLRRLRCRVGLDRLRLAVATVNPPDGIRVGTVGKPISGVEVALADDGELLVRGPGLMKGYRNDPEKTALAVDAQGWMHTGDVGSIDTDGYVRIVDRKKELIINSGGKNLSPSNIENQVRAACPLVGSVVAIGDARPFVVALVALDAEAAAAQANHLAIDASPAVLSAHPDIQAAVQAGVDAANAKLSRVEQIKYFAVLPTFWEPGGDELTPTAKLKRKPIAEKYAVQIESLYNAARRVSQ